MHTRQGKSPVAPRIRRHHLLQIICLSSKMCKLLSFHNYALAPVVGCGSCRGEPVTLSKQCSLMRVSHASHLSQLPCNSFCCKIICRGSRETATHASHLTCPSSGVRHATIFNATFCCKIISLETPIHECESSSQGKACKLASTPSSRGGVTEGTPRLQVKGVHLMWHIPGSHGGGTLQQKVTFIKELGTPLLPCRQSSLSLQTSP